MAESLDEQTREKVKDFVKGGIEDGIKNAWGTIQDPGGWVSGRIPSGPQTPAVLPVARSACRRWARGAGPQGPIADMTYRPFCEEYLDDLGELPGGGNFGRQYPGGQCSITYSPLATITISQRHKDTGVVSSFTAFSSAAANFGTVYPILGPLGGVSSSVDEDKTNFTVTLSAFGGTAIWRRGGQTNRSEVLSVSSVGIVPNSTAPDVCGDGQDGYEPTVYLPDDGGGSEPISSPGRPPFTIDIGPDGDIVIDFPGFEGPGRSVDDPFLPPGPEDYGPQPEPPPAPGDNGEPDAPSESEPGGDVGYCKADEVLKGVGVELTLISSRARVSFLGGEAHYSYAYSVFMGGEGGLERDNESAFARAEAFYHAPENANCFKVAFRNGFAGKVIPYWKPVEEEK